MAKKTPALFLDRDGVIIEDRGHVYKKKDIVLIPGSAHAIARMNAMGVPVVVVTNQAGIGRGLYTEADFHTAQDYITQLLASFDAHLNATYFCPHHPDAGCECRKPRPGMLLQAALEMDLNLQRSLMVGDKLSDLEAGRAVGCYTILARTGYGRSVEAHAHRHGIPTWDKVFNSLGAATDFLIEYFKGE